MSAALSHFPAGPSPTGRTAPVTEILGAGAHPHPIEQTLAKSALRGLSFSQAAVVRFITEGPSSPRFAFPEDVSLLIASALMSTLDIEQGRLTEWQTPAGRDRAERRNQALDTFLPALRQFQKEWARG